MRKKICVKSSPENPQAGSFLQNLVEVKSLVKFPLDLDQRLSDQIIGIDLAQTCEKSKSKVPFNLDTGGTEDVLEGRMARRFFSVDIGMTASELIDLIRIELNFLVAQ
jgi:hypothetical protein